MKIEIRPATSGDSDQWIRSRYELWPDCPPERPCLEVAKILASPGVVALAIIDQDVAGFVEASVRSDHVEGTAASPVPYLEGWYVRAAYRGHGIGRALLSFIKQWVMSKGFAELASDAELQNDPSIRLHAMLGFKEVGRSVNFVKLLSMKIAESGNTDNHGDAQ